MPQKLKTITVLGLRVLRLCLLCCLTSWLWPWQTQAVEFTARGQWIVGFGLGDGNLLRESKHHNLTAQDDRFAANQRFRLQLDACASELLSGTIFLEIGDQTWGKNSDDAGKDRGGALGADGSEAIKIKNAYLEWFVPHTELSLRMGLQALSLPQAAGGSAVLDSDVAAVSAHLPLNEQVGVSLAWLRLLNDNYAGWTNGHDPKRHDTHFRDNLDLFAVSLPITFDGLSLTPWVMYGFLGENALSGLQEDHFKREYGSREEEQAP
ncbi:MAG: hypothetical protein K6G15_00605 [Desulfovibrio sp.]|nr:hypothetical protein [Desulfovibrio sp.]